MNKFVKQQLQKCKIELPQWDENTTTFIIPFNTSNRRMLKRIHIKNYILNEPPNFTLSHEWNNDTVPPESVMWVSVVETRGKMIRIEGKGASSGIPWVGWLPSAGFEEE